MSTMWNSLTAAGTSTALLLSTWALSTSASAQPLADNIAPVGQVCIAGEPCVGQPVPGSGSGWTQAGTPTPSTQTGTPTPSAQARTQNGTPTPSTQTAPAGTPTTAPAEPATNDAAASVADSGDDDFDAAAAYNQSCMACHMTGAAGAPQLDDEEAWNTRLEKGMDAVMQNVFNGLGAMPPRGLCTDCTDEQLRAIADYMISQ